MDQSASCFIVGVALCGHPFRNQEGVATEGHPYNDF